MPTTPGHDLPARVREHVLATGLFAPPGRVLVAVSGGADSLALLHLLHAEAGHLGLQIVVGHVDHGIHPESAGWATVVADAVRRLGVPLTARRLELGADCGETRARAARYAELRRMQQDERAAYLATAHHADDHAETVLFRILKGSGPAGLAGIPARGPRGLRRPLLPFARNELHAWLAGTHPESRPVEDPANADARHERVWLRSVALPMLRDRYPDVDGALHRVARQAAMQRQAWEALLREDPTFALRATPHGVEVERAPFSGYHKVLSVALLRGLCRVAGCRVRGERLAALHRFVIAAPSGRHLDLGEGWVAETVFGRLRIAREPAASPEAGGASVSWGGAADHGEVRWGEWGITWDRELAGRLARTSWVTWVRADDGQVRAPRMGDRLRPLGGAGRRPVRRLLMEARVPRSERARYPVVVSGGRIVWIPGVCRADVALPQPGEPAVRVDVRRLGRP